MNTLLKTAIASALGSVIAFFILNELQARQLNNIQALVDAGRIRRE